MEKHGTGGAQMEHETVRNLVDGLMERWLAHDRQRQEAIDRRFSQQNDQINLLSRDVATLTADVRTLLENQKGLFTRTQPRPTNWIGVITSFVGAVTLWGTATWLLLIPINATLERYHELHVKDQAKMVDDAYRHGRDDEAVEWLKRMEERAWRFDHASQVE